MKNLVNTNSNILAILGLIAIILVTVLLAIVVFKHIILVIVIVWIGTELTTRYVDNVLN